MLTFPSFTTFQTLLWTLLEFTLPYGHKRTITIPNSTQSGPSHVQFISDAKGLDAPKVHPINETVFDFWYFDAVSLDSNASFTIVFDTSTGPAIAQPESDNIGSIIIWASFPNGTVFATGANATETVVTVEGQGVSAVFNGTGASFKGKPDLSRYEVTIDAPTLGVKGNVVFNSITPAHYPCGRVAKGQTLHVSPNIGWANGIADSVAIVDVTIGDSKLQFTGSGYHDQTWGDSPIIQNLANWVFGHGRVGPYSIVWFDILDSNGTEYVSSYAAKDGRIVAAQCSGIKVRPIGANSTYPPTQSSGNPGGFRIDLELGDEGVLGVNVTNALLIYQIDELYTRWVGSVVGGLNGATDWNGVSMQEEFRVTK